MDAAVPRRVAELEQLVVRRGVVEQALEVEIAALELLAEAHVLNKINHALKYGKLNEIYTVITIVTWASS